MKYCEKCLLKIYYPITTKNVKLYKGKYLCEECVTLENNLK